MPAVAGFTESRIRGKVMRLFAVLLAAVLTVGFAIFLLRDLPPPSRITFAAGSQDGGYWNIAERYRSELARDGIEVEILETAGSLENLGLLSSGEADVGLLQGGISTEGLDIEALGTVFFEPIIVFARADREVSANPGTWKGLTIARGGTGSGTRVAADRLLNALDITQLNTLSDLGGTAAAEALLAGEVDLAIFVAPLSADYFVPLMGNETVDLVRFQHADAISLRLPNSRVVNVPSGAVSLDPVVPLVDVPMITLMARLAGVEDLHPAVVDRLVLAARKIHGNSSIFAKQGQFPTGEGADMPLDLGALKLLAEGQSAFHDWLPYWIAAQIRRVLLILLPLLFIVVPLVRILPGVYRWSMHRRVWRHYTVIREIELELDNTTSSVDLNALDTRLAGIEHELAGMRLPPPFRAGAYNARLHVELVRRRISEMLQHPDS